VTAVAPPRPLVESDDRSSFDFGRDSLNAWFRRHAFANHASGVSRINVITERATGRIVGFVALSASEIERAYLAKPQQRNQPERLPVTLLGQLAIERAWQGQGHATSLLQFGLRTALEASNMIASIGVITHPLDDDLRRFYARWGFQDLPFDPRRAMIIRTVDLRQSQAAPVDFAAEP
jgi:GNAT superfamily N-acetyltransferase